MKVYDLKADSEEQLAVVTARTSRSPNTFDTILAEVREKGHVQFLKTNVLGYGHDSVAEIVACPAVALEDISDLAANVIAIADPQLRVQMTSTRYQDMSQRTPWEQNTGSTGVTHSGDGARMVAEYLADFSAIDKILERTDHPRKRTLQCDIARSKLPAGISTQVAIRGDARTMRDATAFCLGHTLAEVREAGTLMRMVLKGDVETLFDRHVTPAESEYVTGTALDHSLLAIGEAEFVTGLDDVEEDAIQEIRAWRDSGWRRRFRMARSPFGPWLSAEICSDYGAYRDLRRNRTWVQSDVLPDPTATPDDALWAFRALYPDVCEAIEKELPRGGQHERSRLSDPYVAPMGSVVSWRAGAHIFNWCYGLRLRSATVCHPGYAIPARNLMRDIMEHNRLADALGLVESKHSLLGVEFSDRVPA
jgi:hypothetical protein